MSYRVITDFYLSSVKKDFKAPAEFDSKDYDELTPVLLEHLIKVGTIEAIQATPTQEKAAPEKTRAQKETVSPSP